jgi:hypothetical protein
MYAVTYKEMRDSLQSSSKGSGQEDASQVTTPGSADRTFFSQYSTPDRSFAAALRSSDQQQPSKQKQQQSSGKHTHQHTNQTSGQSVQTKNVNM